MQELVDALVELERGQTVRLTLTDGETVEGRANQFDYTPDERLRIELAGPDTGDYGRLQVRTAAEDREWAPIEVRGHRQGDDDWTVLGELDAVAPLAETRMMESDEDVGHKG